MADLELDCAGCASVEPDAAGLMQRIARAASASPGAPAVVAASGTLTYGELERQSNRLAAYLRALGVKPDTIVGLCVDRSPALLVGALGILEAGGAYLAMDPTNPPE